MVTSFEQKGPPKRGGAKDRGDKEKKGASGGEGGCPIPQGLKTLSERGRGRGDKEANGGEAVCHIPRILGILSKKCLTEN